jgi:aminoglycoside N3'-acetyltransferase
VTTESDFVESDVINRALENLPIQSGDIAFLTAGYGTIGRYQSREHLEDVFSLTTMKLMELIGNGTLIVPTYSYSFESAEDRDFDIVHTQSKLGLFSNWFLKNVASVRSPDPMISCAFSKGAQTNLLSTLNDSSYGKDCVFEKLLNAQETVWIVNLGLGTKWMPFIHYLDYLKNTPYRYRKLFIGNLVSDESRRILWEYHVPLRHKDAQGSGEKVGKLSEEAGLWKSINVGHSRVNVIDYKKYFEFAESEVTKNKWVLAGNRPIPNDEIRSLLELDLDDAYYKRLAEFG